MRSINKLGKAMREAFSATPQPSGLVGADDTFRSAMEFAPIGMALVSTDGRWLKVNRALCDIFGYNEFELQSRTYQQLTHPDDVQASLQRVHQTLNHEIKAFQVEKRYIHKSGDIIWASLSVSLVSNTDGTPRYLVAQVQNITASKILEEKLQNHAALLQLAHDAVFVRNMDDCITFWNKGAETTYGWLQEDALGHVTHELLQTVFPQPLEEIQRELEQHGQWTGELIHRKKNGAEIVVASRWAVQRDKDGRQIGTLEINRDVTAPKAAERQAEERGRNLAQLNEKLQQSEKFQRLIFETNPDLVFVKDQDYRFVDANASLLNIFPEDMRDKVVGHTTIEKFTKEESDYFLAKDKEAFEKGRSETMESLALSNGERRTFYTTKVRFYNDHGVPFILGISRDMTEREALVQKLLESNTELERFAYVASHDMQEPLRLISGLSDIVAKDYADQLDKDGQNYIAAIRESSERMRDMVRDLLEYARIDKGGSTTCLVDSQKELMRAIDNLNELFKERGGTITADALPSFQGNPVQIMRLLQNLITNALKYQHADQMPIVHLCARDEGNFWHFEMKDNGVGVAAPFQDKIFEPFRRLTSWDNIKGTGLGLAICRRIVENHGGKIWVDSSVGIGSVFHFTVSKAMG